MSNVHNCNAVIKNVKTLAAKQGHRLSQHGRTEFVNGKRPLDRANLICLDCKKTMVLDMDRARDGKIRIAGQIDPLKKDEPCVPVVKGRLIDHLIQSSSLT